VEIFGDIVPRVVGQECAAGSEECVASYLGDYLTINRNSVQCTSFESDVSTQYKPKEKRQLTKFNKQYPNLVADSISFYRECKEKYNVDALALGLQKCQFDSDCTFGGVENKCNRITNRCQSSYEVEQAVIKCLVDNFNEYTEHYLADLLNITGNIDSKAWFEQFEKKVRSDQCINIYGDSTAERQSHLYTTKSPTCGGSIGGCTRTQCLEYDELLITSDLRQSVDF